MADFIFLMHNDAKQPMPAEDWDRYITSMKVSKNLVGGSAIGEGVLVKGDSSSDGITQHIRGYMVINAGNLEEAKRLVQGNPVHKAGGTVEVRHLPRT